MPINGQDYKVIFKVDMSKAEVDDPATVGIRGSEAPLSWTETYPMKGPDKNGMYTVSIPFENMAYGTRIQYKYYHGDNDNKIVLSELLFTLLPVLSLP